MSKKTDVTIPDEAVISKIFTIRGKRVMVNIDLAELYGVPTKRLKTFPVSAHAVIPAPDMFQCHHHATNDSI